MEIDLVSKVEDRHGQILFPVSYLFWYLDSLQHFFIVEPNEMVMCTGQFWSRTGILWSPFSDGKAFIGKKEKREMIDWYLKKCVNRYWLKTKLSEEKLTYKKIKPNVVELCFCKPQMISTVGTLSEQNAA